MSSITEQLEQSKLKLRQAFDKLEKVIDERVMSNQNQLTLEIKLERSNSENKNLQNQLDILQKKYRSIKNDNLGILDEVAESIKQIETLLNKK